MNKQNSLQVDQYFWLPGHNFKKYSKFTLIKLLNDVKTLGLKNLKTLEPQPHGFIAELNFPNP